MIVGASGTGLVIGSFLAAPALGKVGLRRHYAGSIALMALGWGGAALSPAIWVAVPFVVGGAAGNGAAIICNQILVQRGAPDRFRGRALSTIMSTNYLILGLAMGTAGALTDWVGARWVMLSAAVIYVVGAVAALLVTRWLPVQSAGDDHVLEDYGEAAAGALIPLDGIRREPPAVVQPPAGRRCGRARPRPDSSASPFCSRRSRCVGSARRKPHADRLPDDDRIQLPIVARKEWALDELTSGVRSGSDARSRGRSPWSRTATRSRIRSFASSIRRPGRPS